MRRVAIRMLAALPSGCIESESHFHLDQPLAEGRILSQMSRGGAMCDVLDGLTVDTASVCVRDIANVLPMCRIDGGDAM